MNVTSKQGVTLVELLIASFLLLTGFCGLLTVFINSMHSTENSWEVTLATTHAQSILEEMQNRKTTVDIKSSDWNVWLTQQAMTQLPNERVEVTYKNPHANPLDITVKVLWQSKSPINDITLETVLYR